MNDEPTNQPTNEPTKSTNQPTSQPTMIKSERITILLLVVAILAVASVVLDVILILR